VLNTDKLTLQGQGSQNTAVI